MFAGIVLACIGILNVLYGIAGRLAWANAGERLWEGADVVAGGRDGFLVPG
jgi:hypothetical protein